MNADIKSLIMKAKKKGWIVDKTNHDHFRWEYPPTGGYFFSASTPSDWRVPRKILHMIKKVEIGQTTRGISYKSIA